VVLTVVAATVLALVGSSGAWHENPLLTALAGAAVGALAAFGTGSLQGRQQREHDRRARAAEWARQDAGAMATARQQRFDAALALATVAAQDAADAARSLRVLGFLLARAEPPDVAVADLPLRAMSVQDPELRSDLERVAELLATYRAGQESARAVALAQLRAQVPGLSALMAAEAAARAEDLTVLSTTGRAAANAEVEALRQGHVPG